MFCGTSITWINYEIVWKMHHTFSLYSSQTYRSGHILSICNIYRDDLHVLPINVIQVMDLAQNKSN